jgi:hypothetical protein
MTREPLGADSIERDLFRELRTEQRDMQTMQAQHGQRLIQLEKHYEYLLKVFTEEDFDHRLTLVEERARRLDQVQQQDQTATALGQVKSTLVLLEERVMRLVTAANADQTATVLATLVDDVADLKKRAEATADRWWKLALAILEKAIIAAAAIVLTWLAAKGKLP